MAWELCYNHELSPRATLMIAMSTMAEALFLFTGQTDMSLC